MLADIELALIPYDGRTIVERIIAELTNGSWTRFQAAVAFAKRSGNYIELLAALRRFSESGGRIELTFGADVFGSESGSDYEAIKTLLEVLDGRPNVVVSLYHEAGRTFHPKVYLFSNDKSALFIVGSSNWSGGGLQRNVEANVIVRLDLARDDHRALYGQLNGYFSTYWRE